MQLNAEWQAHDLARGNFFSQGKTSLLVTKLVELQKTVLFFAVAKSPVNSFSW